MAIVARPISDLPKFLGAVAVQSKEAAADASNAGALLLVRGLRTELPTRRLQSRAYWGGRRSGLGVNYGYGEADASKAKYKPTAFVGGRGAVHILENDLGAHTMMRRVVRNRAGGRGKPPTIRDIVTSRGVTTGRQRGTLGPTLREVGATTGTITTKHPGVRRSAGPFRRGVAKHGDPTMKRWQQVFRRKATEVRF